MKHEQQYRVFSFRCSRCDHSVIFIARPDGLAVSEYLVDVLETCSCDDDEVADQIKDRFENISKLIELSGQELHLTSIHFPKKFNSYSYL